MSHTTPHLYRVFSVRFDELEPQGSITMSKATWTALEQLETGAEEITAQRYQVKAKSKFVDGDHELDSHYATKHEAHARAKTLRDAGYSTEIVEPTEALEEPKSYARFRVEKQLTAVSPFEVQYSYPTEAEAQDKAVEIADEAVDGASVRVVDGSSGAVLQTPYTDGTVEAPEVTESERAQERQAEQGNLVENPVLPEHPVLAGPPETPSEEWLRKEREAKEHPAA
jgi:hypothetical protein